LINFTDLFTKIGLNGGILNQINTERGTTIPSKLSTLYSEYESTGDEGTIDGTIAQMTGWQTANGSFLSALQSLAQSTVINTVNADVLQPNSSSLFMALEELVAQMQADSQTVQQSVVGVSGTADSGNEGNPAYVYSTKTSNGLVLENLFAEMIVGTCSNDAQPGGGAVAGSETITFSGQQNQSDMLNWQYPQGSGSSLTITVVDASLPSTGGTSQWLANGDFEDWAVTPNVPDDWHLTVGTAGTNTTQASVAYTGSYSLGIVGDGSTLTALEQEFGTDNVGVINPLTQYCVNFWAKVNSTGGSGVLEVALVDGTGNVIDDSQGNANSFTVDVSALTTSFVAFGGSFRTPRLLPSAVYLRVRLSTALSTGHTVYIDRMAFTQMTQFYTGGPYLVGFSGNTDLIRGDSFTITTTNTVGKFQQLFDRYFNMKGLGLLLPSTTGTPTLPDSLNT
jgi:hypothetical protein